MSSDEDVDEDSGLVSRLAGLAGRRRKASCSSGGVMTPRVEVGEGTSERSIPEKNCARRFSSM